MDSKEKVVGTSGSIADLLQQRWMRLSLAIGLPVVCLVLLFIAITVSQLGTDRSILIFTQPQWRSGGTAAVRIVCVDAHGSIIGPARARISLTMQSESVKIFSGEMRRGTQVLDFTAGVPEWPDGEAQIEAVVSHRGWKEKILEKIEIIHDPEPAELIPLSINTQASMAVIEDADPVTVQAFAQGGRAVPNLNNVVFFRALSKQMLPVKAVLGTSLTPGHAADNDPAPVRTDRFGLGAFTIVPLALPLPVKVRKMTDPGEGFTQAPAATLFLPVSHGQCSIFLSSPVINADEQFNISVSTLSSSTPVYVDAYSDGTWSATSSSISSGGRSIIEMQPLEAGIHHIQAYTGFGMARAGTAIRHVLVTDRKKPRLEALKDLVETAARVVPQEAHYLGQVRKMMEEGGMEEVKLAAFLLSLLDRGYYSPNLLVDSQVNTQAELDEFKFKVKRVIVISFAGIGLALGIFLAIALVSASRRRKTITAEMERLSAGFDTADEDEPEDHWKTDVGHDMARSRTRLFMQMLLLLATILGAFGALAALIEFLRWDY